MPRCLTLRHLAVLNLDHMQRPVVDLAVTYGLASDTLASVYPGNGQYATTLLPATPSRADDFPQAHQRSGHRDRRGLGNRHPWRARTLERCVNAALA
jgi:hypothetical protein